MNLSGFNIYRAAGNETPKILNEKPIREGTFKDEKVDFGKDYRYFLRSVSVGRNGEDVESFNSESLDIRYVDTFEPLACSSLLTRNPTLRVTGSIAPAIAAYRLKVGRC